MTCACAADPETPNASSHQAAPPRYDSLSHMHRVQHFDSPAWQDLTPNACFVFYSSLPDGENTAAAELQWEARLRVKARDVPRLMREGFHWTAANFDFEATYIQLDLDDDNDALETVGWTCSRNFFLSDLGDDPHWTARLAVYAQNTNVLSRFRITDLTLDKMGWASAWKEGGMGDSSQWLYDWNFDESEGSFNAIYDDMPLEGWWPWPKCDDDALLESGSADGR
ncbi:hypothetical protein ColTof3_11311 [Colletotrichum tofieldiae]|nr:hypothetical protein ColTof3_11311 [Colletotrichum tofieldiae]